MHFFPPEWMWMLGRGHSLPVSSDKAVTFQREVCALLPPRHKLAVGILYLNASLPLPPDCI